MFFQKNKCLFYTLDLFLLIRTLTTPHDEPIHWAD